MKTVHPKCAGLDVHKDLVVASVRVVRGRKTVTDTRSFGTLTRELFDLSEWLKSHEVTHVAMEATGVFWRPIWNVLNESFRVTLANPATIKNVPGRKTDVKDAEWIAQLHSMGLIEASFVPPPEIQRARELTRTRKKLTQEISTHTLRIQKTLATANIKLASVLSNVLGVSGREILHAIVEGVSDPEKLAELAVGRAKSKHRHLVEALRGCVSEHHRFLLRVHLGIITAIEASIAEIDQQLDEVFRPFRDRIDLLCTIPGVSRLTAEVVLAEIGSDMSQFPTDAHLRSWARMCPRNDESAGKRKSTKIMKGSPFLKTALVQSAWAARRKQDCYLRAQFFNIQKRRGPKKAAIAVGSSILTIIYHMLRDNSPYTDLGPDHFFQRSKAASIRHHVKKLKELGVSIEVTPAA